MCIFTVLEARSLMSSCQQALAPCRASEEDSVLLSSSFREHQAGLGLWHITHLHLVVFPPVCVQNLHTHTNTLIFGHVL